MTARVDELLELMGLGEYRNSFVRELSTGTRRIVDLACLVAHRPTVILLDEPSPASPSAKSRRSRPSCCGCATRWERAGRHRARHPVRVRVADRLIALDQGRVVATGSPSDVLAHPDVVESYLGTSSAAIARSGGTE